MVLGHELGHYAGRDHLEGMGRAFTFALVLGVLGVGDGLTSVVTEVAMRGYGREQEREADAFGLALVQAEYGHVAGATAFFERLPADGKEFADRLAQYISTHPMSDERIEALTALALDRGWPREGELAVFAGAASPEPTMVEPRARPRKQGVRIQAGVEVVIDPRPESDEPLPEVVYEDRPDDEPLPEVVYEDL